MGNAMKKIKSWFPGRKGGDEEHVPLTKVETQFLGQGNGAQHGMSEEVKTQSLGQGDGAQYKTPPREGAKRGSISPEDGRFAAEDLGGTGSDTDTNEELFTDNPLIL